MKEASGDELNIPAVLSHLLLAVAAGENLEEGLTKMYSTGV